VISRRRSRMLLPVAVVVTLAALLFGLPTQGTGATWTATTTASSASAGMGQWCAAPDPNGSGARFIRLSSISTSAGTNQQMAIIPVANNPAWGGGSGAAAKTLGVRLWGCQTSPVGSLRVTAWSNPATPLGMTWLAGAGAVAPSSRLDLTSAAGAELKSRAQLATTTATTTLLTNTPSGDLRRYSWLIGGNRTSAAPDTDPTQCAYLTSALGAITCNVQITNSSNVDNSFANLFNVSPWSGSTITPTTYAAHTWATQSATGWGTSTGWLNVTCGVLGLLICGTNVTSTTLSGTSATDASLLSSANGNLLQWLVIQWTGTTPPPADLVLEVFLQ
jgi:hypothetical protein